MRSRLNTETAQELMNYPEVLWAARALYDLDGLVYRLAKIRDAARDNEGCIGSEAEAHYQMLTESLDNIVSKMQACIADQEPMSGMIWAIGEAQRREELKQES